MCVIAIELIGADAAQSWPCEAFVDVELLEQPGVGICSDRKRGRLVCTQRNDRVSGGTASTDICPKRVAAQTGLCALNRLALS